jgi:hypothetical protein
MKLFRRVTAYIVLISLAILITAFSTHIPATFNFQVTSYTKYESQIEKPSSTIDIAPVEPLCINKYVPAGFPFSYISYRQINNTTDCPDRYELSIATLKDLLIIGFWFFADVSVWFWVLIKIKKLIFK